MHASTNAIKIVSTIKKSNTIKGFRYQKMASSCPFHSPGSLFPETDTLDFQLFLWHLWIFMLNNIWILFSFDSSIWEIFLGFFYDRWIRHSLCFSCNYTTILVKYIFNVNIFMPVQILFPEICDIWVPQKQTLRQGFWYKEFTWRVQETLIGK